jgi:pSer/pThr/pTyr-binding forkhead associated (FHA) protein
VIRALMGWGIIAFAVLQVCEPVMHALRLPEWTLSLLVLVLVLGFPVTIVLAWVFDLGPTGIERTAPSNRSNTVFTRATRAIPGNERRGGIEASPVLVRVVKGDAHPPEARFVGTFVIGRSPDCDVRVTEAFVSRQHLKVAFDGERWWLKDLDTGSGTYVESSPLHDAPLVNTTEVELGRNGPRFSLQVETKVRESPAALRPGLEPFTSETQIIRRYLSPRPGVPAGKQTLMFQRAFQRAQKQSLRTHRAAIAAALLALVGAGGVIVYQGRRIESLRQTAENLFYAMKAVELQTTRLEEVAKQGADPAQLEVIAERRSKVVRMGKEYDGFVQQLGLYEKLSAEDRLVLQVARSFGECDVNVPKGFIAEVHRFVRKWQSSDQFSRALQRSSREGYGQAISRTFAESGLPPQFVFLALQESRFDDKAVGPPTRYGFAKGMWQFIPRTAQRYGLRIGPLQDQPVFDPQDDRFDWKKSTVAASRYLRDLTTTEAQASGLLAMASYNFGEDRLQDVIDKLPKTPEARNFWRLLSDRRVPQETYDYVLSIVAAAVICEAPERFGMGDACPKTGATN